MGQGEMVREGDIKKKPRGTVNFGNQELEFDVIFFQKKYSLMVESRYLCLFINTFLGVGV